MVSRTLMAALAAAAASAHPVLESQSTNATFEDFIARQYNISLKGAIANIGGVNGNVVPGADEGYVVASPSTVNPDYFYTWTRDSALTQLMITDELIFGSGPVVANNSLQVILEQYTTAQAQLQTVTNPSGAFWPAGQGLGEPKFYTNGTRFNGAWGRYVLKILL
jgi:glucoamylase